MHRFFVDKVTANNAFLITGSDVRHISNVLRLKIGEEIEVCSDMKDYVCKIESINKNEARAKIIGISQNLAEPNIKATLFQALPKGDKMDDIVKRATELGIYEIVPVKTHRCVSTPDNKAIEKKIARWQLIAEEAAKQSKRGIIPKIIPLINFDTAIEKLKEFQNKTMLYENAGVSLSKNIKDLKENTDFGFLVGPEGGFEQTEVQKVINAGISVSGLSKRILRTETVATAILAIIMYKTGNLDIK